MTIVVCTGCMKKSIWIYAAALISLTACGQPKPEAIAAESAVAPFIDTHRTATMLGGTTEFSYMEGLAYDPKNNIIYYAMSKVTNNMADKKGHLTLPKNDCGAILATQLDANFQSTKVTTVLLGQPQADGSCANEAIANPDNLWVDGQGRLWIGEDTSKKANNMLWRFDPTNKQLKRFASLPTGAEVAGLHITDKGELFLNVQHPDKTSAAPFDLSTVGVIEGFNANSDEFSELAVQTGDNMRTVKLAKGEYNVLARMGEQGAGVIANADGTSSVCDNPDGNMPIPQADGSYILYTNWECRPGGMDKQVIKRTAGTGRWAVAEHQMVDFKSVHGTWRNCNGSVSPWGTALSSEEDAVEADLDTWESWKEPEIMRKHLGYAASPWDYGYILEAVPTASGTNIHKRYALGRTNFEVARVMPDRRTVYLSDDGNSRAVYKFVADRKDDLTSGTLYVGRFTQVADTGSAGGYSMNVEWLKMGHGVEAEIAEALKNLNPYR